MPYTEAQRLVLGALLNGRKQWKDIRKITALSRTGLSTAIQQLRTDHKITRHQPETDEYPPPVYYEIDPKHKESIQEELDNDLTSREDDYNNLRKIMDEILKVTDTRRKFQSTGNLFGHWASSHLESLTYEVWLAIICATYGDKKTCQMILNHAKRKFAKTVNYLADQADKDPMVLLSIMHVHLPLTADCELADRLFKSSKKYTRYPGREWILKERRSSSFPTLQEIQTPGPQVSSMTTGQVEQFVKDIRLARQSRA